MKFYMHAQGPIGMFRTFKKSKSPGSRDIYYKCGVWRRLRKNSWSLLLHTIVRNAIYMFSVIFIKHPHLQ